MSTFTPKEKERIFIERTQDLWPQNWAGYLELIKHETWSKDELQDYNFKQRTVFSHLLMRIRSFIRSSMMMLE